MAGGLDKLRFGCLLLRPKFGAGDESTVSTPVLQSYTLYRLQMMLNPVDLGRILTSKGTECRQTFHSTC